MLNTSTWPELEMDVLSGIQLDAKNVRLETTSMQVEADILEDLFANEHVLELVHGIAQVGYLTHEIPIVVKRQKKYVVVEGNRRLAALKALQNPMLVPEYQARVSAATKQIPDLAALARVKVKIAPSQDAADQLIAAIHTGNLRRPWTPSRQVAFFQAQLDSGREFKDLLARYPTIESKVSFFAAMLSISSRTRIMVILGSTIT